MFPVRDGTTHRRDASDPGLFRRSDRGGGAERGAPQDDPARSSLEGSGRQPVDQKLEERSERSDR